MTLAMKGAINFVAANPFQPIPRLPSFWLNSHIYGKKHEPMADFPHRDLIVLEYNDVEESRRYKVLNTRREKEKAASNKNTQESVKANTVVFILLALLFNLCSSAKLDWEVCGSAGGTHGLLSNDYMVIRFGVYHIAHDGVK